MVGVRKQLAINLMKDVDEFRKPAFMYHYNYATDKINTIDTEILWEIELANLHKQYQESITKTESTELMSTETESNETESTSGKTELTSGKTELTFGNLVTKQLKKVIKIGEKQWECIMWIVQPEDKHGNIDGNKFFEMTNANYDPIAWSVRYMVAGYCYLQFIREVSGA